MTAAPIVFMRLRYAGGKEQLKTSLLRIVTNFNACHIPVTLLLYSALAVTI